MWNLKDSELSANSLYPSANGDGRIAQDILKKNHQTNLSVPPESSLNKEPRRYEFGHTWADVGLTQS